MIEYIINTSQGSIIYQSQHQIQILTSSNLNYVKKLCMNHFFTYEGYIKAVKKTTKLKYKIPIYLSDQLMFFQTQRVRDYDNIWINLTSIMYIEKVNNCIHIIFKSQRKLFVKMTSKQYEQQKAQLELIRNQKVKHFHCYSCGKSLEIVL